MIRTRRLTPPDWPLFVRLYKSNGPVNKEAPFTVPGGRALNPSSLKSEAVIFRRCLPVRAILSRSSPLPRRLRRERLRYDQRENRGRRQRRHPGGDRRNTRGRAAASRDREIRRVHAGARAKALAAGVRTG